MRLLALDTATSVTAVALLEDRRVLSDTTEPSRSHSKTLLPAIERLLEAHSLSRSALEALAVGIGPGSFTGVRIGLTLAKTLAYAMKLPLVGVGTLRALAENGRGSGAERIVPVLDTVKGEVFGAVFQAGQGALAVLSAEAARDPLVFAQELAASSESCLLLGSGALRHRAVFEEALGERARFPEDDAAHLLRASATGMLGLERLLRGERDDARTLEPLYCRLSDAEIYGQKKT
jgi:tRNA threonylcarbamoyladenosine biosynthesis protein TsaB